MHFTWRVSTTQNTLRVKIRLFGWELFILFQVLMISMCSPTLSLLKMVSSRIFDLILKSIVNLVAWITNWDECHDKLVVPSVLFAFVHWLPRLFEVILLFALMVECLNGRACECYPISLLTVLSCGGFDGVQTTGHLCGGYFYNHRLLFLYRRRVAMNEKLS